MLDETMGRVAQSLQEYLQIPLGKRCGAEWLLAFLREVVDSTFFFISNGIVYIHILRLLFPVACTWVAK